MKRRASAKWNGSLKDGSGFLTSASGVLQETPYSFAARFKDAKGTNPEELIAAAHSGCFAMALSAAISEEGFSALSIEAEAAVALENKGENWSVTGSELTVRARVPGLDPSRFQILAEDAKSNCPISRLLNVPITLRAHLEEGQAAEASAPV